MRKSYIFTINQKLDMSDRLFRPSAVYEVKAAWKHNRIKLKN